MKCLHISQFHLRRSGLCCYCCWCCRWGKRIFGKSHAICYIHSLRISVSKKSNEQRYKNCNKCPSIAKPKCFKDDKRNKTFHFVKQNMSDINQNENPSKSYLCKWMLQCKIPLHNLNESNDGTIWTTMMNRNSITKLLKSDNAKILVSKKAI